MIRWSTPTQPITVRSCDLTKMERVTVSFAQGCKRVDIDDPPMSYDEETGCTELLPTLSQLQTAGFCPGTVEVQVNAIDGEGYRVPTDIATFRMGSNLLDRPMDAEGSLPDGIVPAGNLEITENGTYDVTRVAMVTVDVPESSRDVFVITYDLNGASGVAPGKELGVAYQTPVDGTTYYTTERLNMPTTSTAQRAQWGHGSSAPYAIPPAGKVFGGWSKYADDYTGFSQMVLFEDVTVYAIWVNA